MVNGEEVISFSHAKVHVFSDSVSSLAKVNQNPTSNTVWEEQLGWFKDSPQYRTLDTIDGEPMEFEWNVFPGFTTLQLVDEVQWGMFMSSALESSVFMGKSYSDSWHSIQNTKDHNATNVRHIFEIGVETIGWENHSWKCLSLICDDQVISLQRTKVYVFSDSVLCFGKIFENPESNDSCEQRLGWIKIFSKLQKL